ncbi:MAG TPA: recombinase family protein [Clostridiales bacterium]|jgi:DNA invertase Pin-like site-specific DNA recombinase|nr:recombinase family protein [Clostridiales bacterium]
MAKLAYMGCDTMDNLKLKIAFGYIRESTDDQLEFSPEAQRRALLKYAAEHGYILDGQNIFCDGGISGRNAQKRPEFQRMIAKAKSKEHPCDAILVWKFSRFARNQEESIVYKSMLKRDGVEVISVTEPVADGPFGSLIERIIEWMDEYYSIRLAEEVKKGMTEKARRGGLQTSPPFGYRVEKNMLVIEPGEAAIVMEIFNRFLAGEGPYPIAKWLNEMGVTTRRGKAFENRTIEYILRNPAYTGKLRWNPRGRTRRDFNNENIILSDAGHEPIVTTEVWEAAQKRLDEVKFQWGHKARPPTELKDWPSGLVRCSSCGATLVFSKPHYYKCNGYAKGRCKSSQHISAALLKEAITERLLTDLVGASALNVNIIYKEKRGDNIAALKTRLENLERKKLRLREAFLSGADTVEEYKKWKDAIDADISALTERLEAAISEAPSGEAVSRLKGSISRALETLSSPISTKEQKNLAARSIIGKCTYDREANLLSIEYRDIFMLQS